MQSEREHGRAVATRQLAVGCEVGTDREGLRSAGQAQRFGDVDEESADPLDELQRRGLELLGELVEGMFRQAVALELAQRLLREVAL